MKEINERELNIEEIKKVAFSVLEYVKYICDKYNIFYTLSFGTVLGAVRHNGFIPWDDDIDVCVFRRDYKRLIDAFQNENNERYKMFCTDICSDYSLPHMKIVDSRTSLFEAGKWKRFELGVWVDIFVLDNVPDDINTRNKFFKKLEKYQHYWSILEYKPKKNNNGMLSKMKYYGRLAFSYIHGFNSRKWAVRLEKLAQKYDSEETNNVGVLSFFPYPRDRGVSSRTLIENTVEHKFETDCFPIPREYDEYLKTAYGDYMLLPPIEKRVTHHSYKVIYK